MTTRTQILSILFIASAILSSARSDAQNMHIEIAKHLTYKQPVTPSILDTYLFSTYMGSGKKIYNLKGFEIAKIGGWIVDLKVNPAGYSYAVISGNGSQNNLKIFDAYKADELIYDFGKSINPAAMTYSPDSRYLYVVDMSSNIQKIDSKSMLVEDQWRMPFIPAKLSASGNGYFIAGSSGNDLIIITPENRNLRISKTFDAGIKDFEFSPDSSILGVLLSNGDVEVLNTRDFRAITPSFNRQGADAITIHPDNKYLALAKNGNEIEVINLLDNDEFANLPEPSGSVGYVRFLKDGKENVYLTYNAREAVKYRLIKGLVPNYSKLLREEVIARMEEWSKMAPGESQEQYLTRVNEDSRLVQARLFEEEIATRMADDLITRSEVKLGAYDQSKNTLSLVFDNMPSIYLTVPQKDVADMMDVSNLEFRNPIYGVTPDDRFELVYVQVYNNLTGKSYEFDNRERKSLDYIYASSDFVPIELVRQSGMDEVKLTGIRNSVVDKARRENLISEHTDIDVSTNVVPDVDAYGNPITNYKINFRYTAKPGYSPREDFPPGKYHISQSNAANSMLQIMTQAFADEFAPYIKLGKKVVVKITGSADALPITGRIAYDGSSGEFVNEPFYLGENLSTISLTKNEGIRINEQLAFARAVAVKDYMAQKIPELASMDPDFRYAVEVSDKKGGEYRRISVEFTFVDAF